MYIYTLVDSIGYRIYRSQIMNRGNNLRNRLRLVAGPNPMFVKKQIISRNTKGII